MPGAAPNPPAVLKSAPPALHRRSAVLVDLDGTIWSGDRAIDGAAAGIEQLRLAGRQVLFCTNRSNETLAAIAAKLSRLGIKATTDQVLSSASAAAERVGKVPVFCIGGEGLIQALQESGALPWRPPEDWEANGIGEPPAAIVVGTDYQLTFEKLAIACLALHAGARFIGTNADANGPSRAGIIPGNGATLAALERASGRAAEVVGKPQASFIQIALNRLQAEPQQAVMVGDNLETDIGGGINAGVATVLIMTGVTKTHHLAATATRPDGIAQDWGELATLLIAERI